MLTIEVIGYKGIVGNATYTLLSRLGHKVVGTDNNDIPQISDIAFVCIPEGEVTAKVLQKHQTHLFVIRSTILPGTCEKLQDELKVHVLHNPEFIREATAIMDEFNPDRIIIGDCCRHHGDMIASLYKPLRKPIIRSKRKVTELTKLACNAHLATLISFWNEVDEIAEKLGISGTEVGMLANTDPRISSYGSRFHQRFGGKCLSKDTRHLIELAKETGINPALLEATIEINEAVK